MPRFNNINGKRVQFTVEEEANRDVEEAQADIDKQTIIDFETNITTKRTSGKAKLKELGLNDDEINALFDN